MDQGLFILLCAVLKETVPEALNFDDDYIALIARRMVKMGAVEWRIIHKSGQYEIAQLYATNLEKDGKPRLPLVGMEVFAKRKEGEQWIRKVA